MKELRPLNLFSAWSELLYILRFLQLSHAHLYQMTQHQAEHQFLQGVCIICLFGLIQYKKLVSWLLLTLPNPNHTPA